MASFTAAQVQQLLAPINPQRVLRANNQSHVSQQALATTRMQRPAHKERLKKFFYRVRPEHLCNGVDMAISRERNSAFHFISGHPDSRFTVSAIILQAN